MKQLKALKEKWALANMERPSLASENELAAFELQNNVTLPDDMTAYFKEVNGTNNGYDESLFQFYSLSEFKKVNELYNDWQGVPDYKQIAYTLDNSGMFYVIANYLMHSFCYVIRLGRDNVQNEVLVVCGGEYKKIANSFSEFLDLYFLQSIELQMPD